MSVRIGYDRPGQVPRPHRMANLPRVRLEVVRGRARRPWRDMTGNAFLIGSTSDSDLVLGDPQFPAAHSYLLRSPRRVSLRYRGEGPEVTVNGRSTTQTTVVDGDWIRTGPYEFRVHIQWPQPIVRSESKTKR